MINLIESLLVVQIGDTRRSIWWSIASKLLLGPLAGHSRAGIQPLQEIAPKPPTLVWWSIWWFNSKQDIHETLAGHLCLEAIFVRYKPYRDVLVLFFLC